MYLEHNPNITQLIQGCKAGKPAAQQGLYKMFASKMLGVCMRYATDRMEAEDMLQNGFIKVFTRLDLYRGEGSFEGWVRRIMVNASIEYYRKHHKMMQVTDIDTETDSSSVDANALSNLGVKELLGFIQQLPPGYKLVFNLYAVEGYSHREIGDMLNITEGASKSQLSRARTLLKQYIAKAEGKRYEHAG